MFIELSSWSTTHQIQSSGKWPGTDFIENFSRNNQDLIQ